MLFSIYILGYPVIGRLKTLQPEMSSPFAKELPFDKDIVLYTQILIMILNIS